MNVASFQVVVQKTSIQYNEDKQYFKPTNVNSLLILITFQGPE